jgi:Cu2+-exporting ATPase
VATLRDKLWVSLALTIPVVLLSDDVQVWVGYSVPPHAGDEYAAAILGTLVFLYGGLVFIRPTGVERADAINIRIPIERADNNFTALGA